jgi:hypothetical protein
VDAVVWVGAVTLLMLSAFAGGYLLAKQGIRGEVEGWRSAIMAEADTLLKASAADSAVQREQWNEERALLMRTVVNMRRSGFEPSPVDMSEPMESWVIDDSYELEVEDRRRNGGTSQGERDTLKGILVDGIREKPLPAEEF